MSLLDAEAVDRGLAALDGWERDGDAIVRRLRFADFRAAIDFVGRVADLADAADHHPDLFNSYRRVEVRLTSHDAGGITRRDLDLAERIDGVVGEGAEPA
ncbi:4a-hydroxytetrahydrobiopterin dehydratase [Egicoccus sp. AB-alg2]|uniref:4a-hydroxytetrahydrobiopterin dehydratase n=1 Tax=Egicoccus sp. AB-alg2 TaxID=3242693 RepID=UPI00359D1DAB